MSCEKFCAYTQLCKLHPQVTLDNCKLCYSLYIHWHKSLKSMSHRYEEKCAHHTNYVLYGTMEVLITQ